MNVSILGAGYVGLVTGICLASQGHRVRFHDTATEKLDAIRSGTLPIHEPGLQELLDSSRSQIEAYDDLGSALREAEVVYLCVGTPSSEAGIDLSQIEAASNALGRCLGHRIRCAAVVVKSTVVPGTTLEVVLPELARSSGVAADDIPVCMNPEFLREGCAVSDCLDPDRIVVGTRSLLARALMHTVHAGLVDRIVMTDPRTAETIKYASNSYLALNISFANEIGDLCESLPGVDAEQVLRAVTLDRRFSPRLDGRILTPDLASYLRPGCGFGGSCFPKDLRAIVRFAEGRGVASPLLEQTLETNERRARHVWQHALAHVSRPVERVAVLGTAFKPDTDDVRESPGIRLLELALEAGLEVRAHDYAAAANTRACFGEKVKLFEDPLAAMHDTDLVFVATAWRDYATLADATLEARLRPGGILVDCRAIYANRPGPDWRLRIGVGSSASDPLVMARA